MIGQTWIASNGKAEAVTVRNTHSETATLVDGRIVRLAALHATQAEAEASTVPRTTRGSMLRRLQGQRERWTAVVDAVGANRIVLVNVAHVESGHMLFHQLEMPDCPAFRAEMRLGFRRLKPGDWLAFDAVPLSGTLINPKSVDVRDHPKE